jgi:hypothetical protein
MFYKVCIPWLIHSGLRVAKLRLGSNILILARPQSITYTMSSIVTELSAMFVAMTIFLQYGKRMQTNIRGDVEDRVVLFTIISFIIIIIIRVSLIMAQ